MREHEKQIPIWFFIGALLAVYGLLILGSGIYGAVHPPPEAQRVALWHLHADIWWGALVLLFGALYVVKFWPREGESLTGRR
jgi:hypothetical protein